MIRHYLAVQGYWLAVLLAGVLCATFFAGTAIWLCRRVFRIRDSRVLAARLGPSRSGSSDPVNEVFPPALEPGVSFSMHVLLRLKSAVDSFGRSAPARKALTLAWRLVGSVAVGSRTRAAAGGWLRTSALDQQLKQQDVELIATVVALTSSVCAVGLALVMGAQPLVATACALGGLCIGSRQVYRTIRSASDTRQQTLLAQVVPWLDMLALSSEAGLSFDRSVEEYAVRFDGELPHLLREAHVSWTTGLTSREAALERVAQTVGSDAFSRVVGALTQALVLGSPLAVAAESYAQDMRAHHASQIEELIGKAPVKMLMPLGGLILPAMLILLFTPILAQVFSGLRGGW